MRTKLFRKYCLLIAISIIVCNVALLAQQMPVTIESQVPLLLKILSFDRNLKAGSDNKLTIAILYQEKYRSSKVAMNEFMDFIKSNDGFRVNNYPVKAIPIELGDLNEPRTTSLLKDVDVFYITPVRAFDVHDITRISRSRKITTMSGVPDYIHEGISIGLDLVNERPKILININAAKSEAVDFNSQLLKLAEVIE